MNTFLSILLIAAMLAVVVVLLRGLAIFLLGASREMRDGTPAGEAFTNAATKSNKMMQYRVMLQAGAIFIVVLLLWMGGQR